MSTQAEIISRTVDSKVGKLEREEEKFDPDSIKYSKLYSRTSKAQRYQLYIGWLAAALTGFGLPSFIFLFGDVLDSMGVVKNIDDTIEQVKQVTLYVTYIACAIFCTSYLFYGFLLAFSEKVARNTKIAYLKAVLTQDAAWFDMKNYGELPSRMNSEIQMIQKAVGEKMGTIIFANFIVISGFIFGLYRGWALALIVIGCFPICGVGMIFSMQMSQKGTNEQLRAYGQSAGFSEQALNAIKVVTAFGQQEKEAKNYGQFLGQSNKIQVKNEVVKGISSSYLIFSFNFGYIWAFFFGCIFIKMQMINDSFDRVYTAGDVLIVFFGVLFGLFAIGMGAANYNAIAQGKEAAKHAFDIIENQPEIKLDSGKKIELNGDIKFDNLNFYYPSKPDQIILNNLSCHIEAGKTTAIVGPSGSGKSTIIQLIERFYDPYQGSIIIDGNCLKDINLRQFRQNIGYVGQEPVLFNSSVKQNLQLGKENATDQEIIQALKQANAWEFIENLEKGIETIVGNQGGSFSGGQKQRLALARAFIKKPKILLLDEATSALDRNNEKKIQNAIEQIRKDLGFITIVVIAHRLSTIKDADKIIVMEKGKVVEEGNHQNLIAKNGLYSQLVNKQENIDASSPEEYDNKIIDIKSDRQQFVKSNSSKVVPLNIDSEMNDEKVQLKVIEEKKEEKKEGTSLFVFIGKLKKYATPQINIPIGMFFGTIYGSTMPIFGALIIQTLFQLFNQDLEVMYSQTMFWIGIMALTSSLSFVCGIIYKMSFAYITGNITQGVRADLYNSLMCKNIGWFDERDNAPGVLTGVLSKDVQQLNGVSSEGLTVMIEGTVALITGLVLGFYFCWQVTLVSLGCFPFMIIGGMVDAKQQAGFQNISEEDSKNADLIQSDAILNYKTVQSFANEDQLLKMYDQCYAECYKKGIYQSHLIGIAYGFSQFIQNIIFAVLYYSGAEFQKMYPDLNSADVFIAIFAIFNATSASGMAQQFGPDIAKSTVSGDKIFKIIEHIPEIELTAKDKVKFDKESFKGEIEFKDVWFAYPTRKSDWVFKGLNLKINTCDNIAIVGESGCGKSTLTNLLLRFYDVDEGQILIDGVDIKDYNIQELRNQMGLIQQEPILFNYSIKENIIYGNNTALNSEILSTSEQANIMEFINETKEMIDDRAEPLLKSFEERRKEIVEIVGEDRFNRQLKALVDLAKKEKEEGTFQSIDDILDDRPSNLKDITLDPGFNTQCGIRGSKLSGGQKQRIAIARAIIRKPKILIMDEATSALDENSQSKVQASLEKAMEGRTSIIIAHRLTTIEKCKRLIIIENGVVAKDGTFNDLKQSSNYFKKAQQK